MQPVRHPSIEVITAGFHLKVARSGAVSYFALPKFNFVSSEVVEMAAKRRRKSKREAARRKREQEKSKKFVFTLVGVGIVVLIAFVALRMYV
jgi:hypothetical protein